MRTDQSLAAPALLDGVKQKNVYDTPPDDTDFVDLLYPQLHYN